MAIDMIIRIGRASRWGHTRRTAHANSNSSTGAARTALLLDEAQLFVPFAFFAAFVVNASKGGARLRRRQLLGQLTSLDATAR